MPCASGTAGRAASYPAPGSGPMIASSRAALSRTVRDSAALLDALGAMPGFRGADFGRAADDPTLWALVTRWDGVGSYRRSLGALRCRDIMFKDVATVDYATPLDDAWALLRERRVKALPVVDRSSDELRANIDALPGYDEAAADDTIRT